MRLKSLLLFCASCFFFSTHHWRQAFIESISQVTTTRRSARLKICNKIFRLPFQFSLCLLTLSGSFARPKTREVATENERRSAEPVALERAPLLLFSQERLFAAPFRFYCLLFSVRHFRQQQLILKCVCES